MAFAEYPMAQPRSDERRLPLLVRLHDWVVTVDHKRLGIWRLPCSDKRAGIAYSRRCWPVGSGDARLAGGCGRPTDDAAGSH